MGVKAPAVRRTDSVYAQLGGKTSVAAIVDRFYAAYTADVAAAPDGHGMDYVHCFMVIAKDG